jgi:hypothetical protein
VNAVMNLRAPRNAGKLSSVQTTRDPSSMNYVAKARISEVESTLMWR